MSLKYFVLQALLLFACVGITYAQQDPAQLNPSLPSANQMNLGLFQEIPVSGSSGIPNISVPVYTIHFKGTDIPVQLSYHASGVRPDVHPSWVGSGWSLASGGSITRVIRGIPDDANGIAGTPNSSQFVKGYYFNYSTNSGTSWSSNANLQAFEPNNNLYDYAWDREPDEFNFSFGNHSGKFFLGADGTWHVQSDEPLTVTFNGNFIPNFASQLNAGWDQSISPFEKFTITDGNGVQYVFGEASAIEYSDQIYNPNFQLFEATSWMLKRVVSADKVDTLEFTYERGPFQGTLSSSFTSGAANCSFTTDHININGQISSPVYLTRIKYNRTGLLINFTTSKSNELYYSNQDFVNMYNNQNPAGNGLHDITTLVASTYPGTTIGYFNRHPEDLSNYPVGEDWNRFIYLKLDQISISDTITNEHLKNINLVYNNSTTQRLNLASVNFQSGDSQNIETYGLTYYNDDPIPNYNSVFNDEWGYTNTQPLPLVSINEANIATYKAVTDLPHARSGTLETITYPTGGNSTFEYEQNTYYGSVNNVTRDLNTNNPGTAGGLRIKKIHTVDNNGNDDVRTYYYTSYFSNGVNPATTPSSGILQGIPVHTYSLSGFDQGGQPFTQTGFISAPVYPLTASSTGQNVSYGQTAEQRSDEAYTLSTYTNNEAYNDLPATNVYDPPLVETVPYNDRSFERGRLLIQTDYTPANQPVRSTQTIYQRPSNPDVYSAPAISQTYYSNCHNSSDATNGAVSRSAYELYWYPFVPLQKITTVYDLNGLNPQSTTTNYTWDFLDKQLENEETTNSNGQQTTKDYFYPNDPAISVGSAVYQAMTAKNMIAVPIQTETDGPTQISLTTMDYAEWPTGSGKFYPQDVKQRITTSGTTQTLTTINGYDNYGNVLQQTSKDGVIKSFGWGYNNSLPVAVIENAQNTFTQTTQNATKTGSIAAASGNSASFTTSAAGNIVLSIQLNGAPSSAFIVEMTLNASGINLCFPFNNSSYCGPSGVSTITLSGMPAGTYNLTISHLSIASGASSVQANITYSYTGTQTVTSGLTEFFVNNFEDDATAMTGTAHTGNKFHYAGTNSYTISWPLPNSRTYILNYWYRNNGIWKVATVPFNGTAVLTSGDAYDDIRICPSDAHMTTYTYDPLVGMTSSTDERELTTYYHYDTFQRLTDITDKNGNIIKHIEYHYQ